MYSSNIDNPLESLCPEQKNGLATFLKKNDGDNHATLAKIVSGKLGKVVTENQLNDFYRDYLTFHKKFNNV